MAKVYAIVKKNSTAHKNAVLSHKIKGEDILEVTGTHVMIPSRLPSDFGVTVSHAKNRNKHRRASNGQVLHVEVDGEKKAVRLTNRHLRTFKKITANLAE